MAGEQVKLWTIQRAEAWSQAQKMGEFKADGRRVDRDFGPAYRWMIRQMTERLPTYSGEYPVWAWAVKPDLRHSAHLPAGSSGVRIECNVASRDILISDFAAWHCVLNNWYCALSETEDNDFMTRSSAARSDSELHEIQAEKEASWQRIFDIEQLEQHSDWWGKTRHLQVTLGRFSLSQVVRVRPFIAR